MTASRDEASQRMRATGSSRDPGSWPHEMAGEPGGLDEEFLYHLSRGSEFLIANQVVQAKEELERALAFHPLDARSQDLLASVYFRLGVYPRAIEIWTNLVQTHGEDVALRVNLGLALLKTAQPDQALGHLARAVARDPTHERAWRYVGLAEWRVGNLDRAREAFLRGGQASMARRMEEMLGSSVGQIVSQEAAPYIESTRLSLSPPALGIGPDAEPAAAPVVVLGAESIPPSGVAGSLAPAPLPSMPPADLMPEVHAPPGRVSSPPGALNAGGEGEERFALTHDGTLVLRPRRPILARQRGLRALVGSLPTEPSAIAGLEDTIEPRLPFYRFAGQRVLYFTSSRATSPRATSSQAATSAGPIDRFELLRLESESFVVRAAVLFAFDEQLTIERTARAAALGEGAAIELRGSGLCALSVPRTMAKLSVQASDEVRVELDALIGFTGPLFLGEPDGRWVTLRGEGVVFFV